MCKFNKDDSATVNLDLMFAFILFISMVTMAYYIMPTISQEDKDWRNKQYMVAVRTTDNLVQDTGDQGWETKWNNTNYLTVSKIGLVHDSINPKILSIAKTNVLMINYSNLNGKWWEFPSNSSFNTSNFNYTNATRTLGLNGYNFYMQLYPVSMNPPPLSKAINIDTSSKIDRYVYIKDESGNYLIDNNTVIHYILTLWVW